MTRRSKTLVLAVTAAVAIGPATAALADIVVDPANLAEAVLQAVRAGWATPQPPSTPLAEAFSSSDR